MEYTRQTEGNTLPTCPQPTITPASINDSLLNHSTDELTLSTIHNQNSSKQSHNDSVSLTRLLTRIRSVERMETVQHNQTIQQSPPFHIPKSPTDKQTPSSAPYLPRQLRGGRCSTVNLLGGLKDTSDNQDLGVLRLKAENLELKEELERLRE